jgi:probable rRNA maturation factor
MLDELGLGERELSVLLTDDDFIRGLNQEHRGKDRPTDVLAFPLDEDVDGGKPAGPLPAKQGKKRAPSPRTAKRARASHRAELRADPMLGDVIISLDTAARQARERRHSLLDEVCFLLAHGLLHLVGYDHETDEQERVMDEQTTLLVRSAHPRGPKEPAGTPEIGRRARRNVKSRR